MEVINEILMHINILLMTSDGVFLHWRKHFQKIFNGNFLYFYFCKDEMHVDFFT